MIYLYSIMFISGGSKGGWDLILLQLKGDLISFTLYVNYNHGRLVPLVRRAVGNGDGG